MRPDHDGSNVLELSLVLSLVLGQGHKPTLVEVLGYISGFVKKAEDMS